MGAATRQPTEWDVRRVFTTALGIVALAVAYDLSGRALISLTVGVAGATAIWIPSGLAVAAVLIGGYRLLPGVFLGTLLLAYDKTGSLAGSLVMGLGNSAETFLAAWFASLSLQLTGRTHRLGRGVLLRSLGGIVPPAVSASVGVTVLLITGAIAGSEYMVNWGIWVASDALGILIVASMLIVLWRDRDPGPAGMRLLEFSAVALLLVGIALVWSEAPISEDIRMAMPFLFLPPIAWVAFRFGFREMTVAVFVTAAASVASATTRLATPAGADPTALIGLQITVALLAITGYTSAAIAAERRAGQESLRRANVELEEASRAKDSFLAAMSHDLRTPLNSIIGFTGIMLDGHTGPLSEEQTRQLGMVRTSGEHLLSLVNDILDLSRMEAGRHEFTVQRFDARAVVWTVISLLAPAAYEKELELEYDEPEQPMEIECDRRALQQILTNIVGNAVKFTQTGSVKVVLSADEQVFRVSVSDSGPGIPPREHEAVFEDFQRARRATASQQGSGLGLPIARRLARALGGEISLKSTLGQGATFTLVLPIAGCETPEPDPSGSDSEDPLGPGAREFETGD